MKSQENSKCVRSIGVTRERAKKADMIEMAASAQTAQKAINLYLRCVNFNYISSTRRRWPRTRRPVDTCDCVCACTSSTWVAKTKKLLFHCSQFHSLFVSFLFNSFCLYSSLSISSIDDDHFKFVCNVVAANACARLVDWHLNFHTCPCARRRRRASCGSLALPIAYTLSMAIWIDFHHPHLLDGPNGDAIVCASLAAQAHMHSGIVFVSN